MKNRKQYIEAIVAVLSEEDASRGLHIDMIAQRLIVRGFPVTCGQGFDELRSLANRLILYDCRRGSGYFQKAVNPKNGCSMRGVYLLRP